MKAEMNADSLKEFVPYIVNFKSVLGLLFIAYSIYTASTDLPTKWQGYWTKVNSNNELLKSKTQLSSEEAKLTLISKELDKFTTKILEVKPGNSPQLDAITTAQKVITLSEASKNLYMGLEPGPTGVINIANAVTLPIQIPGASQPAGAPAPATPPGTGAATATSNTDLNSFEYTLSLRGSYVNLVRFIHNLVKLPDFIIIKSVDVTEAKETNNDVPDPDAKAADRPDINMKLTFSVPWK